MHRNRTVWRRLLIGFLALQTSVLSGCGYRLIGASAEAPRHFTVAVPILRNLTYSPAGEGVFTEVMVQALLRHGIQVRDTATADYLVSGEIVALTTTSSAFSGSDMAVLYRSEVEIELTISNRRDNHVLLRERFRRQATSPVPPQRALQANLDAAVKEDLARQIAQDLLVRIMELEKGGVLQ